MIRKFFMKPPAPIKNFLNKFPAYRVWFIKQVCRMLREDATKGIENDILKGE